MKPTYVTMLLAFVLFSCAPLHDLQAPKLDAPFLGSLGKEDHTLVQSNFKQIGQPILNQPLVLSVQEIPFKKSSFKSYRNNKARNDANPIVLPSDSIPTPSTYLKFEIKDKIGCINQLNAPENIEVRTYLSKDSNCKLVSTISMVLDQERVGDIRNAEALFLSTDSNGLLSIALINGNRKEKIRLAVSEIFEYGLLSFCWGTDTYGNAKIQTLNDQNSCPKGTVNKAQKLNDTRSYLKL